jgi:hypothetical protein
VNNKIEGQCPKPLDEEKKKTRNRAKFRSKS